MMSHFYLFISLAIATVFDSSFLVPVFFTIKNCFNDPLYIALILYTVYPYNIPKVCMEKVFY